jgi:hypothetical protein
MSFSPESESFLTPEDRRPEVPISLAGEGYFLNWQNTVIREFRVGVDEFDHIVIKTDDEKTLFVFKDKLCEKMGEGFWEGLHDNNFPVRIYPVVDELTMDIYAELKALDLDDTPPIDL